MPPEGPGRLATSGVLLLGALAWWLATDGFRAITSEGVRRLAVEERPRPLPDVRWSDHRGETFSWEDLRGRRFLVEFIFTTCPDVCQRMSSDFAGLAEDLATEGEGGLRLLSISFDPERDTTDQLARVAAGYGADGGRWRFARTDDREALAAVLDAFGVVVIPSAVRRFEHNAAIHGVDAEGRLARIGDLEQAEEMLRWALSPAG